MLHWFYYFNYFCTKAFENDSLTHDGIDKHTALLIGISVCPTFKDHYSIEKKVLDCQCGGTLKLGNIILSILFFF